MKANLSIPVITHKPKKWFGLATINLDFLDVVPEAKFTYAAITSYYKIHMALDSNQDEFTYKEAKRLMERANQIVKKSKEDCKGIAKGSLRQLKIVATMLVELRAIRYDFYSITKRSKRYNSGWKNNLIALPQNLLLTYTLDEVSDIGSRLMNRLNSTHLYKDSEESEERAILAHMLDVVMPRIWIKYVNTCQNTDKAEPYSKIMTEVLEYIFIMIYKIDNGVSLSQLTELPSMTVEVTAEHFKPRIEQ